MIQNGFDLYSLPQVIDVCNDPIFVSANIEYRRGSPSYADGCIRLPEGCPNILKISPI